MNLQNQNISARRRTTRSKTIYIDPNDLQEIKINPIAKTNSETAIAEETNTEQHDSTLTVKVTEGRTFEFSELINAFKMIEKEVFVDPFAVRNILKIFKTKDEILNEEEENEIKKEKFPPIANNPFFRRDLNIAENKRKK